MAWFRLRGRVKARRHTAVRHTAVPLAVEQLEDRTVLSGSTLPGASLLAAPTYQILNPSNAGSKPFGDPGSQWGYTPQQMAQAYGFNQVDFETSSGSVAGNGAGETIAIVDAYDDPDIATELTTFDKEFGVAAPPTFTKIGMNGEGQGSTTNFPAANPDWSVEISLDVEWSHAMAPAANIVLVEAYQADNNDLLTAVNYAANYAGVSVVSMSWGDDEFSGESSYDHYFTTPTGHTNVTFIASSGDSGAGANWPAVSDNVVAAGGTSLNADASGNYDGETGWSDSGGGISSYETAPSYQQGLKIYGAQADGMRAVPDIAYNSDPDTGVPVYAEYGYGGWVEIGGTSAASPQWASIIAIANQGRTLNGKSVLDGPSQTLPLLYQASSTDFHDITSGSNGEYSAGPGYDLVTGIGSPIVNELMPALGAPLTQPVLTSVTITPTDPSIGDGGQLQFSAVGYDQFGNPMSPQPSFAWSLTGSGTLNSTGLYTAPALGSGSGVVQVQATEGGVTVSNSTNVTYSPGPAITNLTANPNPVTATTTTLSAQITDPNPGNVKYAWSELSGPSPAPSFQNGSGSMAPGTLTTGVTFSEAGSYVLQLSVTDALGIQVTATVPVTVNQTLTTITVSPSTAGIADNAVQQFTATAIDQFGAALVSQPTFTWSVVTGGQGTITSTGVYTAPATGTGTDTVEAAAVTASGTVDGTASVTYTPGISIVSVSANPNPVTGPSATLNAVVVDPNSQFVSYEWLVVGVPEGLSPPYVESPSGTVATGSFNVTALFFDNGTYTFQLTVNDTTGASATTTLTVTVDAQGPVITSLTANPNPVAVNASTTLTALVTDADSQYINFTWSVMSLPVGASPPSILPSYGTITNGVVTASATFVTAGVYQLELSLTDGFGLSTSDTITITVGSKQSQPPTISNLTATPNPVAGDTTTLSATVADSNTQTMSYVWSVVRSPKNAGAPTFNPASGTTGPGALSSVVTFAAPGTYVLELTVTDGLGLSTSASVTVTVNTKAPTITNLTANPNPVTGTTTTASAQVALFDSPTATYTWQGASTTGGPAPTFSPASGTTGSGTVSSVATFAASGTYQLTLTVTDSWGASQSSTVNVTVMAQSGPTITNLTATPNPVYGKTTTLSAQVADSSAPSMTYAWSLVSGPAGAAPPTFNPASGTTGNGTLSSVATFSAPGTYVLELTVSDSLGLSAMAKVSVSVVGETPTITNLSASPNPVTTGTTTTASAQVAVFDSPTATYSWQGVSTTGGPAPTFSPATGTTGTASLSSVATFTAPGTYQLTLTVTDGWGLSASSTVNVTVDGPPTITNLTATPNPVYGKTTTLSAQVADGNTPSLTYAWSVVSGPFGATPPTFAPPSGTTGNGTLSSVATFAAPGTYVLELTVTDGVGLSTSAKVSVSVIGEAPTITNLTASPNPVTNGTTTASAQVAVFDTATATYSWQGVNTTGGPAPTFSPASGSTGTAMLSSVATFTAAGTYQLTLTVTDGWGLSASSSVTVTVETPPTITNLTATPNPVYGKTTTLSAQVADSDAPSMTYAWSVVSGPAGATPPTFTPPSGTTGNGTVSSVATFSAPGTYVLELTVTDSLGLSTSAKVSVSVIGEAPTITNLTASPNPVTGTTTTASAQVAVFDTTTATYTWQGVSTTGGPAPTFSPPSGSTGTGSVSSVATFTATGTYHLTLTVTDGWGLSTSSTVTVTVNGQAPTITNLTATPSPVNGTTTTLSAQVAATDTPTMTYTWTTLTSPQGAKAPSFSAPSGSTGNGTLSTVATFYAAGKYQFQLSVVDGWGLSATSQVSVTVNQTLTTVTLNPSKVTVPAGGSQQFAATAYDQFGNAFASPPSFAWSVLSGPGSITSTALYSVPITAFGTAVVQASATVNGTTVAGTANVTVTAAPPVISQITATPNPVTGTTTTLSVVATDPAGGTLSYAWSTLSGPSGAANPKFGSANSATTLATFYAAGNYTFQVVVTSQLTGASTDATVSVTVKQTLKSVIVTPSTGSVVHNKGLQLSAIAYDQFGEPINTHITWTLLSGPGSVSSTGFYTAPRTAGGVAVVQASATVNGVTVSGTAALTIT